jgi:hypothetical protein
MALNGIGGNGSGGGSPLDRFQQLRDSAQKKIENADRQSGLAELIQRKQKQLGQGASAPGASAPEAARFPGERIPPGPSATGTGAAMDAAARAGLTAPPSAAYGRSGSARQADAAPRLGQYVDFRA